MWTGWIGNDGKGGGPVIDNAEKGYGWTTYPERLESAGISWKIYQDIGKGLDAAGGWGDKDDPCIGNYGDNSLLYFNQYRTASPGNPLYDRAPHRHERQATPGLLRHPQGRRAGRRASTSLMAHCVSGRTLGYRCTASHLKRPRPRTPR